MKESDLRRIADPLLGRLVWLRVSGDAEPLLARVEAPLGQTGRLTFARVDPVTHESLEPMFAFEAKLVESVEPFRPE